MQTVADAIIEEGSRLGIIHVPTEDELRAMKKPSDNTTETALNHLGFVLKILAELSPNDRCRALDEAQAFYNAARPDAQIEPMQGYVTRLVQVGPLDWPMKELVHV
jgi:hypothetical protein